MDRRRFVKSASWGTAGLLLSSVASKGQDNLIRSNKAGTSGNSPDRLGQSVDSLD
jgi:hypothetical protein